MKNENESTQTCKRCDNVHKCSGPDWLTGECGPGFKSTATVDKNKGKKKEKSYDCTDCKHFSICYLRRNRANREDVTPCDDIELDELLIRND